MLDNKLFSELFKDLRKRETNKIKIEGYTVILETKSSPFRPCNSIAVYMKSEENEKVFIGSIASNVSIVNKTNVDSIKVFNLGVERMATEGLFNGQSIQMFKSLKSYGNLNEVLTIMVVYYFKYIESKKNKILQEQFEYNKFMKGIEFIETTTEDE